MKRSALSAKRSALSVTRSAVGAMEKVYAQRLKGDNVSMRHALYAARKLFAASKRHAFNAKSVSSLSCVASMRSALDAKRSAAA